MHDDDLSVDAMARALVECYQRKNWLEEELAEVNLRATTIIEQIRALPYTAGLERHAAPADADTERFRVPEYVVGQHTRRLNPISDSTARMVRPVACPVELGGECAERGRHIHTADGAVHPVRMTDGLG